MRKAEVIAKRNRLLVSALVSAIRTRELGLSHTVNRCLFLIKPVVVHLAAARPVVAIVQVTRHSYALASTSLDVD